MNTISKPSAIKLVQDLEKELNDEHKGVTLPEKVYERVRNRFVDLLASLYSEGKLDFLPTGVRIFYDTDESSIVVDYNQKVKKPSKEAMLEEIEQRDYTRFWVSWSGKLKSFEEDPVPYTVWKLTQTDGENLYFALLMQNLLKKLMKRFLKDLTIVNFCL